MFFWGVNENWGVERYQEKAKLPNPPTNQALATKHISDNNSTKMVSGSLEKNAYYTGTRQVGFTSQVFENHLGRCSNNISLPSQFLVVVVVYYHYYYY